MKSKTMRLILVGFILVFGILCTSHQAFAQVKSYVYDRIDFIYQVNKDSTVDVSEVITYDFTGQYNMAYRDLTLDKVDAITDISVSELSEAGDKPLVYSRKSLDKLDPSNWGKYSISNENGSKRIEWYFNAKDTSKTWKINYTLHGSISFYKDIQELYWDLFSSFEAPIGSIKALVFFPTAAPIELVQGRLYYSKDHTPEEIISEKMQGDASTTPGFQFGLQNIADHEIVTIAAGWPLGLVSQRAYFIDALKIYGPYILSVLLVIGTIVYLICLWYVRERKGRKRTIVAEYEPPQGFTPAMTDVILHEYASIKSWPATIVDLAVRGYVRIDEDVYTGIFSKWINKMAPKDFILSRVKADDAGLKEYEVEYLYALMPNGTPFSTKEYRKSRSQQLVLAMENIKKTLYKGVSSIDGIYDVGVYVEHSSKPPQMALLTWVRVIFFAVAFGWSALHLILLENAKYAVLFTVFIICYFVIWYYRKYEARLSMKGELLKYQILGFKEFLKVTGKDRMQNLTPDIFEKYLPYAMVFGVEKQWAKKFESMHLANPQWYGASGAYIGASSAINAASGASSFSASAFSSSLSSSFSSAMSSSGGGGSGGGGGAGGGGGGGGGGAS